MTVFITDARLGDRFTQLRREIFADNFPASALITVAGLARPEMLVEVHGRKMSRPMSHRGRPLTTGSRARTRR